MSIKSIFSYLTLILLFIFTSDLASQTDTLYLFGTDRSKKITKTELDILLQEKQTELLKDTVQDAFTVKYEVRYDSLSNDTLYRFGGLHYIALSLLNDHDKANLRLNKPTPDFEFLDLYGKKVSSLDMVGKIVLINFWFTRCAPCIEEMPYLNLLKKEYESKGIIFLSMAPEEADQIHAFLTRHDFNFRHIPDADVFLKQFGIGFPKNILIDKKGVIRYIDKGIVGVTIELDDSYNEIKKYKLEWDALKSNINMLIEER